VWIGLESLGESIPGHQVEGVVEQLRSSVQPLGNRVSDCRESVAGEDVGSGIAAIALHDVLCDKKLSETRGATKISEIFTAARCRTRMPVKAPEGWCGVQRTAFASAGAM
jgi:hypothetical protein